MPRPTAYFSNYPEAFPCSKRISGIPGKFLVREIGVVLDRTHGLNDVDSSGPVADGKLRSPDGDIQIRRRVHEFCFALTVIRDVARDDEIPDAEMGFGPVEIALYEIGVLYRHHSHSIVAGGFPEMSYVTREMPFTSLMMRRLTRSRKSYGNRDQRAVMKSIVSTARSATT